jgi:hypothetical protein
MVCPNCRQPLPDDVDVCVHCGIEFRPLVTWSAYGQRLCQRPGMWIAGIGLALTFVAGLYSLIAGALGGGPDILSRLRGLAGEYAGFSWWEPGLVLVAIGIAEIVIVRMIFERPRRAPQVCAAPYDSRMSRPAAQEVGPVHPGGSEEP